MTAETHEDRQQTVNPEYQRPGETRKFSIEYTVKCQSPGRDEEAARVDARTAEHDRAEDRAIGVCAESASHQRSQIRESIAYWELKTAVLAGTDDEICLRAAGNPHGPGRLKADVRKAGAHLAFTKSRTDCARDHEVRKISGEVVRAKPPRWKSTAIYDYVLANMTMKNHAGWGQGSTRHPATWARQTATTFTRCSTRSAGRRHRQRI